MFQLRLKGVSSSFKGHSRAFERRLKGVSGKGVPRKFQRSFKEVSRVFQENSKGISEKFQGCFKEN